MRYELHMFFRKLYMSVTGKSCDTCRHYDGRFGDDDCFQCERSIRAVGYDRGESEKIF